MDIYLDMDGVVTNFMDSFLGIAKATLTHDQIDRWHVHECIGMTEDGMLSMINSHGTGFWSEMPKYPWADALYGMLAENHPVTYLTSPGKMPSAASGKMMWLHREHGEDFDNWIFTKQKHHLARGKGALLIDDSDKNCEDFIAQGGRAIVFPQPWNSNRQFTKDRLAYIREQIRK